jgi:hypothetical protein
LASAISAAVLSANLMVTRLTVRVAPLFATNVSVVARTSCIAAARQRPPVVTVAMANKTARIVWAVLARGDVYRPPVAA